MICSAVDSLLSDVTTFGAPPRKPLASHDDRCDDMPAPGVGDRPGPYDDSQGASEGRFPMTINLDWGLRKITDYWDYQTSAVPTYSQLLETVRESEWPAEEARLASCVRQRCDVLSDEWLVSAAGILAEDLYKGVLASWRWRPSMEAYLRASAGALLDAMSQRGFVLQYVVHNSFAPDEVGLAGPLIAFPLWFGSAGFACISAEAIAFHIMEHDAIPEPDRYRNLGRYIREAQLVAAGVLARLQADNRHFAYFDGDMTEASRDAALREAGTRGVLCVFRTEAPVPKSRCHIIPPEGMTLPFTG